MSNKSRHGNRKNKTTSKRDPWSWGLVGGAVLVVVLIVLVGVLDKNEEKASQAPTPDKDAGSKLASKKAPSFSAVDALTGKKMTNRDFPGKNLLLFFSEGVSCQACLSQVEALESETKTLKKRNIKVIHISVDPEDSLNQVAKDFNIKHTPLLADSDSTMSTDYDMLGKGGMGHPDKDGHAFMLVSPKGKILWEQEYEEMFVEPEDLFADMPKKKA